RDIPPAGAIRCVDKRVGVDVDEGGLVRSFGGSHGLLQVFDGVLPGLDFDDIKAVAVGIHGQVNGQDLLALEVLLFFVVLAVPGTKALRTNGFGQVADGSIAVVLDKYDNHLDAFGNCGNQLRVEHQDRKSVVEGE